MTMQTSKPCFRVPFSTIMKDNMNMNSNRELVARLQADPHIHFTAHTIDIDYTFEDIDQFYKMLKLVINETNKVTWLEKFATPEYKEEIKNQLNASRDHFDKFPFGPEADAGIVDGAPAQAAAQQAQIGRAHV